jgi:hypothetical protein
LRLLVAATAVVASVTAEAAPIAQARTTPPRAAVLFLQSPARAIKGKPFLKRVAAIGGITALGYVSAVQGSYSPEQVLLDMSSGSRATTSLYDGELPEGIVLRTAGARGSITDWPQIDARARTPPADVKPGTLAGAVGAAGGTVGYAGIAGRRNREAIVAADRSGGVARVSLGNAASVGDRAAALWRRSRLVVVKLPGGRAGRSAVRSLLAVRRPPDLVLVIQDPNATPRRLLAAGAAGLEGGKDLRSASTRTDGLVVTTDLVPTVLDRLGARIPATVTGEPIEAHGGRTADDLVSLRKRFGAVGPRRWAVVLGGLAGAIGIVALLSLRHARRIARCALLAALWLPAVLLVTGALGPPALVELVVLAAASALLALGADRLIAWPRSIALPAAVTVAAHVLDLALGSKLIDRSLLGPNPLLGARFYGIGNELEITLAVTALLGLGAALTGTGPRARVWGFALGGATVAFLLSWGRLGADVGAALTLGVGTAAAAVVAAGRGSRRTRAAIVLGAPAVALAGLAALDLATGGNAHFTRTVLRAGGLDELAQVAQRRFELSYTSLGRGAIGPLVVVAVAAILAGWRLRGRLLANVLENTAFRAGLYGALAAVVAGALTNDSGPVIFLIGTTYLALAVGYVVGMPKKDRSRPARKAPLPGARNPR